MKMLNSTQFRKQKMFQETSVQNYLCLILTLSLFFVSRSSAIAQPHSFMFYNVENLMDSQNDSITNDDEFIAGGARGWSEYKVNRKINHIAKVILAANGFNYPDVVGLCEVENFELLDRLVSSTPLSKLGYRYIHKESPDGRGIDVALLYRPSRVTPLWYKHHPLRSALGDTIATREILECQLLIGSDSLHVFINHWPSRYGGEINSANKRMLAAQTLWNIIEKRQANSIIMGDFNDEPHDSSMQWLCQEQHNLVNLSAQWNKRQGTLKYQSVWSIFDQIIISDELNDDLISAQIINLPFLLQDDEKWGGQKLHRTYHGYKYEGGFSDHLPVMLLLNQR